MQSKRPIIIGIAGGSGSGKTTIAHEIYDQLQQDDHILIMAHSSINRLYAFYHYY